MRNESGNVKRLLGESKCIICGKLFYRPDAKNWAYKYVNSHGDERATCSYKCNNIAKEKYGRKKGSRKCHA